jgi:hypothetical protein
MIGKPASSPRLSRARNPISSWHTLTLTFLSTPAQALLSDPQEGRKGINLSALAAGYYPIEKQKRPIFEDLWHSRQTSDM